MRFHIGIVLACCLIFLAIGIFIGKEFFGQVFDSENRKIKGRFLSNDGNTAELQKK